MKKLYILILLLIALSFLMPDTIYAIPAFARKYGFTCTMCHTAYPKLNDFGQRFRDNGYQIPGQEGSEKNVLEIPPPISLRTSTGLSIYDSKQGTTSGFNVYGLDLLAAGVLHKNISFLIVYTPRIDVPAANYTGTNPSQPGSMESANIVFSNIIQDAFNLRIGRFEPAPQVFSSHRSFYIMEPYEVYSFMTPANSFVFADNQIGVEATGHFKNGFKYGVGIVNGNGGNPDNSNYKDVYLNLIQVIGKGDGQSAGQRVGLFGYYGWQPTVLPGTVVAPTGETNGSGNKPFYRLGGDVSLNWSTLNLEMLLMQGNDDKALNTLVPSTDYRYSGGFVEVDWAALMNNRLIASVLYNWVSPPSYDNGRAIKAYSLLVRHYLGDWTAFNVVLHGEYTYREIGITNPIKDNLFTILVDFDF
ncbi:MAG: hypothetical protein ACYC56_15100 [Candidatus Aquicultor sp.]